LTRLPVPGDARRVSHARQRGRSGDGVSDGVSRQRPAEDRAAVSGIVPGGGSGGAMSRVAPAARGAGGTPRRLRSGRRGGGATLAPWRRRRALGRWGAALLLALATLLLLPLVHALFGDAGVLLCGGLGLGFLLGRWTGKPPA
jgi:hypothetical protein